MRSLLFSLITFIVGWVGVVYAEDPASISELANLNIQDLMTQEVSSVLRKEQPVSKAAAAIYVISQEDIRRSGSRSLPELLRMVPGITVVRTSAGMWSVTARGFDSNGSSKLLVLIDGRSVYSPTFSGVFWDVQDVMAEDIERIEVIRGPGAVSWGENAVNGVINVITKNASDTTGLRVIGGLADHQSGVGSITYGEKVGEDTYYRMFGKYFSRDSLNFSDGNDDWYMGHGGFRADSKLTEKDALTFQGDIYDGRTTQESQILESFSPPFSESLKNSTDLSGGNSLLRWTRTFSPDSELKVQGYFDRTNRSQLQYAEHRNTMDLDIQHHIRVSDSQDFVYGINTRQTSDSIDSSFGIRIDPATRTDNFSNTFLQDEITVVPETFNIIPGIKLGYNDYSQFDTQPALKFLWTPTETQTVWASVARAVRSPARLDEDVTIYTTPTVGPDGVPNTVGIFGRKSFDAEQLMAYEVGYRTNLTKSTSFDVATFYHKYDDLLSVEPGPTFGESSPSPFHTVQPFFLNNKLHGSAYGVETLAKWKVASDFDLAGTYSYIGLDLSPDPNSFDPSSKQIEDETPHNQATLKAHLDLTEDLELNSILYYVDSIRSFYVPRYLRTDLHLGYKVSDSLLIDLAVQNLTGDGHREWSTSQDGIEIDRTYFGKLTYRFK